VRLLNLLTAIVIFPSIPALAQDKPQVDYASALETMKDLVGGTVDQTTKDGRCVISVSVDRAKVDSDFTKLQKIGLLNPDITQTFMNTHRNPAPIAMATQLAVMTIISKYKTTAIDKCAFVANLLVPDEFGNAKPIALFGFGFDRQLFDKINWDNFENSNLPKVSYQYKQTAWTTAHFLD
jgi:hypothetical protein